MTVSQRNYAPARGWHLITNERVLLSDKIQVGLISGYLAIAGVYWLPGLSHILISQIKLSIFGVLFAVGVLHAFKPSRPESSLVIGLGLTGIAAFVANSMSTDVTTGVDQARDFLEPMGWLIALMGVRPRAYGLLFSALLFAMTGFFLLSLYPVAAYVGLLPVLSAPESFLDPLRMRGENNWILEAGNVINAGFTGSRTGWGVIVALSGLMTIALFLNARVAGAVALVVAAAILLGSLLSILTTGARGGTIALFVVAVYGFVVSRGLRFSRLALAIVALLVIVSIDLAAILPESFFRGFDAGGDLLARINAATTGRLASYAGVLEQFTFSPIVGVGPEQAKVWINQAEQVAIHNIWLRVLVESGLFVFIPVLLISIQLARLGFSTSDTFATARWPDASLVVLCGLVLGLAEPSVIFGTFNANATFWTAVWLTLARPRQLAFPIVRPHDHQPVALRQNGNPPGVLIGRSCSTDQQD